MQKQSVVLLDPVDIEAEEDVLRINRSNEKQYAFDHTFDQTASQVRTAIVNIRKKYLMEL